MEVPSQRIRARNSGAVRQDGNYVLYWMTAYRRLQDNFSLDRALEWGRSLGKPVLVFEALRLGYPWASDRIHTFVLQGMVNNRAQAAQAGLGYFGYVEPEPGHGKGLLRALGAQACVVVTDEFPCFMLPRMVEAGAAQISVRMESVDSVGLLHMASTSRTFDYAHSFRRHLQKELRPHLAQFPDQAPLRAGALVGGPAGVPADVLTRWPHSDLEHWLKQGMQTLPLDHQVEPVLDTAGGSDEAAYRLSTFVGRRLNRYAEERNLPEESVTSGLSAYLHFGHVSAHRIFREVTESEGWSLDRISEVVTGSREGWWGVGPNAEAFLDQLITWRELGFNFCWNVPGYDTYDSLPAWAKVTLAQHAADPRRWDYSLEQLESATTHDPLWNAAQRQLLRQGVIHNYLRMLWGKKILEWSTSHQEALVKMIHLNDKYALDGRDPNSYSGIFWVLGRYDRAWGPERRIFGKIRYMTSENTARKVPLESYLHWFR